MQNNKASFWKTVGETALVALFPLVILQLPWWADIIILFVLFFIPYLDFLLWVSALVAAITQYRGVLSLAYFVYFGFILIAHIIRFIRIKKGKI